MDKVSPSDLTNGEYSTKSLTYPSVLEIESTSRCNVNPPCPMCMRVNRTKDEFDMPPHLVQWLINPISSAKRISISGIGEPMMSKDFDFMVSLVTSAHLSFFSNGQVLTDENIDLILGNCVSHIDFSLDASTAETYRKIRGYNLFTFDRVIANIERLVAARKKRNMMKPSIHLIMVGMKENYLELSDLIRLACRIKVEGVRYWRLRKPSVPTDYKEVERNGFFFSYKEQADMTDLDLVVEKSKRLARDSGLFFAEN